MNPQAWRQALARARWREWRLPANPRQWGAPLTQARVVGPGRRGFGIGPDEPLSEGSGAMDEALPAACSPDDGSSSDDAAENWVQCDRCNKWRSIPQWVADGLSDATPW